MENKHSINQKPGNEANRVLCVRSFSDLDKEIEHDGRKFVPIRELARLSGFGWDKMPVISWGSGTGYEKGNYSVSNIKLEIETIDKYHAFVFSIDRMLFIYQSPKKHEIVEQQFLLYQKLREWGFIE